MAISSTRHGSRRRHGPIAMAYHFLAPPLTPSPHPPQLRDFWMSRSSNGVVIYSVISLQQPLLRYTRSATPPSAPIRRIPVCIPVTGIWLRQREGKAQDRKSVV